MKKNNVKEITNAESQNHKNKDITDASHINQNEAKYPLPSIKKTRH